MYAVCMQLKKIWHKMSLKDSIQENKKIAAMLDFSCIAVFLLVRVTGLEPAAP